MLLVAYNVACADRFPECRSKYFRFLSGDKENYMAFFVQMVRAMVRKEQGHEFNMLFLYTKTQQEKLRSLIEHLAKDAAEKSPGSKKEAIQAYQTFCWSLVYTPESTQHNEVNREKDKFLMNDEGQVKHLAVFHSSPPASKLPGYMAENILTENIQHCDQREDDLLRENIRNAIQKLLQNPTACEKSKSQMEAILLIMRKRQDALITMQTGGGRGMLWLKPPLLDPGARFIVVCPFTVLLDQQCELAQRHGLRAIQYGVGDVPRDVQILFVQVEHCKEPAVRARRCCHNRHSVATILSAPWCALFTFHFITFFVVLAFVYFHFPFSFVAYSNDLIVVITSCRATRHRLCSISYISKAVTSRIKKLVLPHRFDSKNESDAPRTKTRMPRSTWRS